MQHILIITDQPIVGIGLDFALKKHMNEKISVKIKSFDKNYPTGLIQEMYNGLVFCLTTKNADLLATIGKPLHIPMLICANIKKRDSIKKLVDIGFSTFLNFKSEMTELMLAIEKLTVCPMGTPKIYNC